MRGKEKDTTGMITSEENTTLETSVTANTREAATINTTTIHPLLTHTLMSLVNARPVHVIAAGPGCHHLWQRKMKRPLAL
eukprot:m.117326 g.117326  ORF g.117326 m.117326 type:complete len:80 (+) comp14486_c0_seq3:381-620(+)